VAQNYATYAYDLLGRTTAANKTSYAYSTQSALSTLTHNLTGTAQDQTTTYTRNQVQEITGQSWTNDSYQWTGYANGTKSYTANGLNQYTAAAGATLTHDTRGNLTGDGVWTYTYDLDNQLISANKTGSSNSLAYDGAGRLRQTTLAGTVTGLTYDGVELVAEYNSGGTLLRRYVHGPGVDEPLVWYEGTTTTNKTWLYQDQLGSVIGTANSAGTSTAIHSYGPYGEPNIATGIRFRYTGQQFIGSLNLYYYKARFYSPALGRFLQTDPIGTADDLNLYAYVGNNPINFSDPSGLIAAEASMLLGKVGSTSAGQFALGFIPGYDLYSASQNPNATMLDYGVGVLGILPGMGKGAGLAIKAGDNLVGAAAKVSTLKPGPFAKESIPGHMGKPTAAEQKQVNTLMEKNGCHTCGTKDPGTKSGNAVVDHQPAQALGETKEFLPHCIDCMRRQGGEVLQEIIKRGNN